MSAVTIGPACTRRLCWAPMTSPANQPRALPPEIGFSADRRQSLRRQERLVHLAWLLPIIAFALVAAWLYRQQLMRAEDTVDHAARIAQEQALKIFETNDMLLQRMLDLVGDTSEREILDRGAEIYGRLKALAATLPQVQGLFIVGADARMLATSLAYPPPRQIDYSDREGISIHRQPGVGVFFTEQLRSRISGEPFFDMSVRRSLSDGTYAGSVSVSLKPSYLTNFYAELGKANPGLRLTVLKSDGRLVARWPTPIEPGTRLDPADPLMSTIASGIPAGSSRGPTDASGIDRLRAYRQLSPYPLYVVAALEVAEVRAAWLEKVGTVAVFAVPTTLLLSLMARSGLARTRREVIAAQRLDDETLMRQRMEVALLQSQKLEALGRLTSGVAHDFNNLLSVVTSNLFLLRRKLPGAAADPSVAAIERAVSSGTKLTRQLLAFTRRQALVPERVSLQRRLPELLELVQPLVGRGIEIETEVEPDTPDIFVDPAELELALLNLAVNAKDAMPNGGRLRIHAGRSATTEKSEGVAKTDTVSVVVSDTGIGMSSAIASRALEPFFTTKPVGQGTGLGLSQVQALCQAAGGDVRIDSREGEGTEIVLEFPAVQGTDAAVVSRSDAPSTDDLAGRILLVEDNDSVAEATQDMLEAMGLSVERVSSAEGALTALDRAGSPFDLVLSDIEMPGRLDGIGLAEAVVQRHFDLPVVLMTGYAERLQQAVAQRFDVLPKPLVPSVLSATVKRGIERRSRARA